MERVREYNGSPSPVKAFFRELARGAPFSRRALLGVDVTPRRAELAG